MVRMINVMQWVYVVIGIALLFLSYVAASDILALGAMVGGMFAFLFGNLARIELKVDAMYAELMTYEIVEDDSEEGN